jgi:hypothetical protein
MVGIGLVLGIGLVVAAPLHAQRAEPSPVMKKLGVMAGEWRGTAVINGREGRMNAVSYEKVESKLGGLALWVYGRHVDAADTTKIVHEAVGMLYYDGPAQKLKFVPMVMNGLTAETWANATEQGMDWGFALPNNAGQIRYHVDLSQPDTWIETGEYSRDGTQWLPTIRMELKKVR